MTRLARLPLLCAACLLLAPGALAQSAGDPTAYDPDREFTILEHGAALGDPALFLTANTGRDGFTVVTTSLSGDRFLTLLSLVEPAQNGSEGSGHVLMLNAKEARAMIDVLRKGPLWVAMPRGSGDAAFNKSVVYVRGAPGGGEMIAVQLSMTEGAPAMEIHHAVGGGNLRFQFAVHAAQKFANQIEHHLNKGLTEAGIPLDGPVEGTAKK